MKRLVGDFIKQSQVTEFVRLCPDATVFDALKSIRDANSSVGLVMRDGVLLGIFTKQDFTNAALHFGVRLFDRVSSHMTKRVYYVDPNATLEECLHIMSRLRVSHLPVIESGGVVGLITMRHIMEALLADRDHQIDLLMSYITGSEAEKVSRSVNRKFTTIRVLSTKSTPTVEAI